MLTAHMELIDGQEIPKPVTKKLHAFIQTYLAAYLKSSLPRGYRVATELNVLCRADRLVPDVVVVRREAAYDNGDLAEPAILAVEIASPGQTFPQLVDRCKRLLGAGTPACWIILPETRRAWILVLSPDHRVDPMLDVVVDAIHVPDFLDLDLTGFSIRVELAEMWAELDD